MGEQGDTRCSAADQEVLPVDFHYREKAFLPEAYRFAHTESPLTLWCEKTS